MDYEYYGCKIRQREAEGTCEYFVFIAPAKQVRTWAGVKRSSEHKEGTQRIYRKTRGKAIQKFLAADLKNTIPNNILVAFGPGVSTFVPVAPEKYGDCGIAGEIPNVRWGHLTFSFEQSDDNLTEEQIENEKPALVVDGQHRLFGIASFDAEDVPLLIVGLIDASPLEQAFQFIVINDKSVKVHHANAKSIIADLDEDALTERLLDSGIKYGESTPLLKEFNDSEDSPFKDLLRWDVNRDGIKLVDVTAIEQMERFTRDYFGRYLEQDDDSLLEIMFSVWKAIKFTFPHFWIFQNRDVSDGQKKFFSKVNILALHEFMTENLKKGFDFGVVEDIYDSKQVIEFSKLILDRISPKFWSSEWRIQLRDNKDVRTEIKNNLEKTVENAKMSAAWNKDLDLIKNEVSETD